MMSKMESFKKWITAPSSLIGIGVIVASILGWQLVPHGIELQRQARAGALIEGTIQSHAAEHTDQFACLLPILTELPPGDELTEAIALLEQAVASPPNNPHSDYLLGRAYCLRLAYPQAVDAFEAFSRQRPNNPLGWMEQGFANFSWAQAMDETRLPEKSALLERSRLALLSAGIDQQALLDRGDEAYQRKYPQTAWLWYLIAESFGELPDETALRLAELSQTFQPVPQARAPFVSGIELTSESVSQATSTPTPEPSLTPMPTITPTSTPGPALMTPFGSETLQFAIHQINEGESLALVAANYNTTTDVLMAINARESLSVRIGELFVVCVGCPTTPDVPPLQALFIEEGMMINELADQYRFFIEDLRRWNGLGAGDWIDGGRWLVIPLQ
jgi:tetratricopeptide (TPR) repeat protein